MVGLAKVSNEQWEFLLSFMENHPGMARGTQAIDGAHSKMAANQLWEELATNLNNVGTGHYKSLSDWRNFWKRQRYEVRKKACERRAAAAKMGAAPLPRHLELTEREKRVLKVLGPMTVFGCEFVRLPYVKVEANTSDVRPRPPEPRPPSPPRAAVGGGAVGGAQSPTRVLSAPGSPEDVEFVDPSTVCATSLDKPQPSGPDRSRTTRPTGPVPVSRPYRRYPVPPDVWTLQIEERRLRIEAKRAYYQRELVSIGERRAKAAEKNNEIMALLLGEITKIRQSLEK